MCDGHTTMLVSMATIVIVMVISAESRYVSRLPGNQPQKLQRLRPSSRGHSHRPHSRIHHELEPFESNLPPLVADDPVLVPDMEHIPRFSNPMEYDYPSESDGPSLFDLLINALSASDEEEKISEPRVKVKQPKPCYWSLVSCF